MNQGRCERKWNAILADCWEGAGANGSDEAKKAAGTVKGIEEMSGGGGSGGGSGGSF